MKQVMRILPLALLLFLGTTAFAQIDLGARAGINLANQNFDAEGDEFEPDSRLGLQFAATLGIPLGESGLRLQPELSFIQKGYMLEFEFLGQTIEEDFIVNYLEVPIMLQYVFGEEDGFFGFAQAGPSVGYAMSGKSKSGDDEEDFDFDEAQYERLEFGAQFGIGIGTQAGPGQIYLDARYLLGLTNLNGDEDFDDIDVTNNGIGISVGYRVPIGQ